MESKAERPNIVLINCDDLGYGDVGCYGSKVNRTPGIDYLAENGMRCTSFYMASPVCSPSRGAMMTGCYPPRIGFESFEGEWVLFPGQGVGLNRNEVTIAKILQNAGYRTKLVGKWHCGDQEEFLPVNHGFDEYYGLPYSNDMGRQVFKENFPPLPLISGKTVIEEQPDQRTITERYVEQCRLFLRENKERNFFLYLAHMHVHLPLYAGEEFVKKSVNGDFGACVEAIDWSVRVILHELRQLGLEEKTLIIFTSDNGGRGDHGGSNAPLRGNKGTTWEGGQRVPCIFYWPGHITPGQVCDELLSSLDFYRTLAQLGQGEIPENIKNDSLDIRRVIFENEKSPRESFYYYIMGNLEAVRDREWKLHVAKDGKAVKLLYHIVDDPGENENVYDRYPEVVKRLEGKLSECREQLGDSIQGIKGKQVRAIGRVDNPHPLTEYNVNHPYVVMMYDREEVG